MSTKWTTEQKTAIEKRGCDILVSAAAGSGKTAVLVERIIKIITDKEKPVDIDRLLVLTFTKAAAAEMRQRISDSILKLLHNDPDNENLKNQLALLNKAHITTIHSFCMDVVRQSYALIDADPSFRVADEAETALIEASVLDELFEEKYSEGDEEFIALLESFDTGFKDLGLKKTILNVYRFTRSMPFPDEWIDEMTERYNISDEYKLDDTFWGELIKKELEMRLGFIEERIKGALNIVLDENGPKEYAAAVLDDADKIHILKNALGSGIESFAEALNDINFKTIGRKGKETPEEIANAVKQLREGVKSEIKDIKEKILFKDINLIKEDIIKIYPFLKALGGMVKRYGVMFDAAKKKKQLMDFNDLEHYCLKALIKKNKNGEIVISESAEALRSKFYEILTDEYQDSNAVQEIILSAVSKGRNRFMVGDVKQSIYKFRMAMPEIFMSKYYGFMSEDEANTRIDLYKNFRSRENILNGINFLFEMLMSPELGDVVYDDAARLSAGADFEPYDDKIMLDIIESKAIKDFASDNDEDDLVTVEIEARHICERINELMDSGFMITDKATGKLRKASYGDIVILLRSAGTSAEVYAEVFDKMGIPLKTDISSGFFNTTEVMITTNFLSLIDNPRQDIPLISVLYSPIYGLSADDLMNIKFEGGKGDFYGCLKHYRENGSDGNIKNAVNGFFDDLELFRNNEEHLTIAELILKFYSVTGYFDMAGAITDGKLRQANLRMLVSRAESYENSDFHGLFNFIKYIERIKTTGVDVGEAKTVGGNTDMVRLMTIHKSKGLEFPIVFVAGLGKKFNKEDSRRELLMHQDLGFGVKRFDYKNRIVYETASRRIIGERITRESLSEELRVLYVALTRARDKLFLVGSVSNLNKRISHWGEYMFYEKPTYGMLLREQAYLDWIAVCIMRHESGEILRDIFGVDSCFYKCGIYNSSSKWKVNIIGSGDFKYGIAEISEPVLADEKNYAEASVDEKAEIKRRLSWHYSFEDAADIPANVSISELKRIYQQNYEVTATENLTENNFAPEFEYADVDASKKVTAARRGSAVHAVMERVDFRGNITDKDIKAIIDSLAENGIITYEEADSINVDRIMSFFDTDIYRRIKNSVNVYREEPFAMTLKSGEVFGSRYKAADEKVLLHGIIDCFFEEDDGKLVLLDYKTDFNTEEETIRSRYKIQMDMYKTALEKATGKKVKESYIYLFGSGKFTDMR